MDAVVAALIEAVVKQGEFLASLGTAAFGGCIALIVWRVTKVAEPTAQHLKWLPLVIIAAAGMGISILLFYLGHGNIIAAMPDLATIVKKEGMTGTQFRETIRTKGLGDAQFYFKWQFFLFIGSIFVLLIFGGRNTPILKRKSGCMPSQARICKTTEHAENQPPAQTLSVPSKQGEAGAEGEAR